MSEHYSLLEYAGTIGVIISPLVAYFIAVYQVNKTFKNQKKLNRKNEILQIVAEICEFSHRFCQVYSYKKPEENRNLYFTAKTGFYKLKVIMDPDIPNEAALITKAETVIANMPDLYESPKFMNPEEMDRNIADFVNTAHEIFKTN